MKTKQTNFKDLYISSIINYYQLKNKERMNSYVKKLGNRLKYKVLENIKREDKEWIFKEKMFWFINLYIGDNLLEQDSNNYIENVLAVSDNHANLFLYNLCFQMFCE